MSKSILIADDSASMREMLSLTLSQAGYPVTVAVDGVDALKQLTLTPPKLLITDLNMPNMDGIELIKKVRALPQAKFIPIVMLTTESQEERKQQGKAAGASAWMIKPFKPEQLLAVVGKLLR